MTLSPWGGDAAPCAWWSRRITDGSTLGSLAVLRVMPARGGYAWGLTVRHGIEAGDGWRETRQAACDDADAHAVSKGFELSAGARESRG